MITKQTQSAVQCKKKKNDERKKAGAAVEAIRKTLENDHVMDLLIPLQHQHS